MKIVLNNNKEVKRVPISRIKAYSDEGVCFKSHVPFLFSDCGEGRFIDFDRNVLYEPEMLFLPQHSLKRLHKPDYTRKDAFLIGTTLYIYDKPYTRTMQDDKYGSTSAEVITVTTICTVSVMGTEIKAKNIKIPNMFYFLNESTIKQTITKKGNDIFYEAIKEFSKFDYI